MGHGKYSIDSRKSRAELEGYSSKSAHEIFTQSTERRVHASMDPKGVVIREACDSEKNPNTVPVQLYLDVTGSMGHIPHELIKDGLPTLMGSLMQRGVEDPALMFGAVGDHECDRYPLQIGQFESGDAELDMWLTRTYLEGGGGGNAGESYLLAWYFAAYHTRTDAFDKRGKKGFVFTIGDEPCLNNLPVSAVKDIMANTAVGQGNYSKEVLLAEAQKKNHVFHIFLEHGGRKCNDEWKQLFGNRLIIITDYKEVSKTICEIVLMISKAEGNISSGTTGSISDFNNIL